MKKINIEIFQYLEVLEKDIAEAEAIVEKEEVDIEAKVEVETDIEVEKMIEKKENIKKIISIKEVEKKEENIVKIMIAIIVKAMIQEIIERKKLNVMMIIEKA